MPTATAYGASFGTVIPGVGTVAGGMVGGLIDLVSGLAPGPTVHWQQTEIEPGALKFSKDLTDSLQAKLTAAQFSALALSLPNAYRTFLANSIWWDSDNRAFFAGGYQRDILPQTTDYGRIYQVFRLGAIWILVNIDKARPETFADFMRTFLAQTLAPCLIDLGITDYNAVEVVKDPLTGTTGTTSSSSPATGSPVASKQIIAGISNTWVQLALAGVFVGFVLMLINSHGKGK
jgi:hypothetical protein